MRKGILKRVLVCVLSAGMVMSLGGVSALATETEDAATDPVEDASSDSGTDDSDMAVTVTDDGESKTFATTDGLEAFAVYCADDASLTFYTDETVPEAGSEYDGKTVTDVYTDLETLDLDIDEVTDLPWYEIRENVTSVVIEESFAEAQPISLACWFFEFSNATFGGLENMDTSKVENTDGMFYGCTSLTSVDGLASWNTSNVEHMSGMFGGCTSLESVDGLADWDTSSVEDMESTFEYCTSLINVEGLADWDTSNVIFMEWLFCDCENLESVDVSKWDTSNAEDMRYVFYGCESLKSVDVSNWDTSSVRDMVYTFADCKNLASVDVSKWNTSKVESLYGTFYGCESLASVDVSGWNTSSVTTMGRTFYDCKSLTSVDVSGWNTANVTHMYNMFQNCSSLESLDLSSWDTSQVAQSDANFATGCDSLKWITLGDGFDLFAKHGFALVSQQTWYDSDRNGTVVSDNYMIGISGAGTYYTYTEVVEAFAVYCADDASLTFYTDDVVPAEGDTYKDKTVTNVYTDVESLRLTSYREVPWRSLEKSVTDVVFDDSFEKAQPVSLAYWFSYFANASFSGLTQIDTSNVEEMESMFFDCSGATSLDVSGWDTSNVTDMGVMFSDCYSLESITGLSDWDTSSVECMDSLFNNCFSLESVDVSNWDTSNVTQMGYMFYECESLDGIDVSNWDTSNVEWMGSMFRNCFSLTALDVSKWDTSSVTDMSNMFYQCVALPSVDVSEWDTSHVTTMANMFIVCSSLTGLDVSKWDTSSVWNMSGMFQDCVDLTSLDVSGWDTSNVTSMWATFADCFNLESLDVSGWNTSSVTDMEALFESSTSLTGVDVSNWDTSSVRWMNGMFANCESLTSLDVSGWDTGNVTAYERFAIGCDALQWIKIGDDFDLFEKSSDALVSQQTWYDSARKGAVVSDNYMIGINEAGTYYTSTVNTFAVYCEEEASLTFYTDDVVPAEGGVYDDKTVTAVYEDVESLGLTSLRGAPWYGLRHDITDVVIDPSFAEAQPVSLAYWFSSLADASFSGLENIDTSEVTDMTSMFLGCSSMTSVDVSGWDTSSVEDMSAMFCECTSLTDVDVSGWDISAVENMGDMFSHCTSLTNLDVSGWDTSHVRWIDYMFAYCSSLTSVDVSGWDTSNVELMGLIFCDCGSLESVDVSNWDTSNVMYMTSMFSGCESLTSVDVSGWDTANVVDMAFLFSDCYNLTGIDVSGWDTANVVDMAYLFEDCQSLTSIDVSGWDTTNVTGMWAVFAGCTSLTNVDVSDWDTSNVADMESLFDSCTSLTGVDVSNWDTSNVRWMNGMFANCESLTSLDVSGWDTGNVTTYERFAIGCDALQWIKIGDDFDLFEKSDDALVSQQIWYDSPINGTEVSDDYMIGVSEAGTYYTDTTELTISDVTITSDLADNTKVYDGNGVTLTAAVTVEPEDADLTYQWYKVENGTQTPLGSATTDNTLTLDGNVADSGTYKCEVTAIVENVKSDPVSGEITITIKEPPADKTDLEEDIKEVEDLVESDYTPESWEALQDALAAAEAVNADPEAPQSEVDAAAQALQDAIAALEVIPADKSVLEAAVKAAEALDAYKDYYTEDSWNDLQDALSAAKTVADNGDATQSSVNNATVDLVNALADLVPAQQPAEVDKSVLNAMIKAAEALNDYKDSYTPESWQNMQDALDAAQTVADNDDATQDDVNEAATNLVNALVDLVPEWQPGTGGDNKNGLYRIVAGQLWGYYVNGEVDTSYTGFQKNENGTWYVENGYINFAKSSVYKDKNGELGTKGTWYYVVGNKVQYNFTGLAHYRNANGWWYIVNGVVDFSHNGVDKNQNGWWYVTGGKVRFNFTGLANYRNANGWWYIRNGKVDFTHNGVDKNKNGWWYVTGGKVQFGFTGLAHYRNANGWWYIRNGKVDFTYTGRASNQNGTWNVVNGKVRF